MTYDNPVFFLLLLLLLLIVYAVGWRLTRPSLAITGLESSVLIWTGIFLAAILHQSIKIEFQRTELVHQESDSIAHVYRYLQSLPQSQRNQMRLLLISYLDTKLSNGDAKEIQGKQELLFKLGIELARNKIVNESQGVVLSEALNHMISMHFRSAYALHEHLPRPVLLLLLTFCLISALFLGFNRRHPLVTASILLLLVMTFTTIVDLDDARHGWIQIDPTNLRDLVTILHQQEGF